MDTDSSSTLLSDLQSLNIVYLKKPDYLLLPFDPACLTFRTSPILTSAAIDLPLIDPPLPDLPACTTTTLLLTPSDYLNYLM